MLHYHNRFMRGTRLDVIVGLAILGFVLFLIAMLVGPVRTLAKERDQIRTNHVREIMTKVLLLELVDPEAYDQLLNDTRAKGDLRWVIGDGDCSGSHGPECAEAITSDECLPLDRYFSQLVLDSSPVDPGGKKYSPSLTGYYLAVAAGELEVGACGAAGGEITLQN